MQYLSILCLLWAILLIELPSNQSFIHTSCYRSRSRYLKASLVNKFADIPQLPTWLVESCERLGFKHPTPVQANALPEIFKDIDAIIQSQTGSGKTLTYALPILAKVDASRSAIQAVIVTPTRELGQQVTAVMKQLAANSPEKIMIMTVVEGSNNRRQQLWAVADPPHIVIGNPPALQRLVDMGKLRLNAVNFVVIDEVDACVANHNSKQELHKLLSKHLSKTYLDANEIEMEESKGLPQPVRSSVPLSYHNNRQTILVSATVPQRKYFAEACFRNGWSYSVPSIINLSDMHMLPENIEHFYIPFTSTDLETDKAKMKANLMCYLLRKDTFDSNADSSESSIQSNKQCIVFIDSKEHLSVYESYLLNLLKKYFKPSETLLEDHVCILTEEEDIEDRKASFDEFRAGEKRILLCSDLAARGIDVPAIATVIQLSLPKNAMEYLHRAGRTGRLDRPGTVYTLAEEEQDFVVQRFMNELNIRIEKKILKTKK